MNMEKVKFDEKGLSPCHRSGCDNERSVNICLYEPGVFTKTIETGETWFFSRSRQELWHKGETSGNTQTIVDMKYDCDQDALSCWFIQTVQPAIQEQLAVFQKAY